MCKEIMSRRVSETRFIWKDLYCVEECEQILDNTVININDLYDYLHYYQYLDIEFKIFLKILKKIKLRPHQTFKFWQKLIVSTCTYKNICTDPERVIYYGKLLYQQVTLTEKYIYYSYLLYFLSSWQTNQTTEYCQYLLKELIPLESCVICMENKANFMLMPCTHIVCCSQCIIEIEKCPVCRSNIENYRKI